jgi:uncharacterized membrane protein
VLLKEERQAVFSKDERRRFSVWSVGAGLLDLSDCLVSVSIIKIFVVGKALQVVAYTLLQKRDSGC